MADIETTVNNMPQKDILPDPPEVEPSVTPTLTAAKIIEIAKELAMSVSGGHGHALHSVGRKHGVGIVLMREIEKAVKERQAALRPEPIEEP